MLAMNGRAVFNFSATEAPKLILSTLAKGGLSPDDVDFYLFHQGSKFIVDTIRDRLGLPEDKVPSNLVRAGNTVSSSIPLLFADRVAGSNAGTVLLCGFGVGLSAASCLLTRQA